MEALHFAARLPILANGIRSSYCHIANGIGRPIAYSVTTISMKYVHGSLHRISLLPSSQLPSCNKLHHHRWSSVARSLQNSSTKLTGLNRICTSQEHCTTLALVTRQQCLHLVRSSHYMSSATRLNTKKDFNRINVLHDPFAVRYFCMSQTKYSRATKINNSSNTGQSSKEKTQTSALNSQSTVAQNAESENVTKKNTQPPQEPATPGSSSEGGGSAEEGSEKKMSLFQRFHHTYKQYGKVFIAVYLVTSTFWAGLFYYIAMSGVDVEPALRWIGASEKIISIYTMPGVGHAAVAYLFYKLATPVRYPVVIGGTHLAVKVLRRWGYMPPIAQENTIRSLVREGRTQMNAKYKTYKHRIGDIRNQYRERRKILKQRKKLKK